MGALGEVKGWMEEHRGLPLILFCHTRERGGSQEDLEVALSEPSLLWE